ncbi:MAG TPA: hypothetical protein VMT86_19260 [Bryobacteraceae bacterium]|nr:hypothetical protein [Bryobacteraceae bacterium]
MLAALLVAASGAAPVSSDAVAVYRSFLRSHEWGSSGPVRLANTTIPLKISGSERKSCVAGIDFPDEACKGTAVYHLEASVVEGTAAVLVDAQHQRELIGAYERARGSHPERSAEETTRGAVALGLLQVSEVAFDVTRQYAVMSYRFACGPLCGNGGTNVFHKIGEEWQREKRLCIRWLN